MVAPLGSGAGMDAQIDLVIFDFDGTLADSTAWAIRAVRPLAERFKFKAVTEDESRHAARAAFQPRDHRLSSGLPLWKVPLVAAHGKKMMAAEATRSRCSRAPATCCAPCRPRA